MNRNLDGIYYRIKRNGQYENVCFTDMTEKEINETIKHRSATYWKSIAMHLRTCIRELGNAYDIYKE